MIQTPGAVHTWHVQLIIRSILNARLLAIVGWRSVPTYFGRWGGSEAQLLIECVVASCSRVGIFMPKVIPHVFDGFNYPFEACSPSSLARWAPWNNAVVGVRRKRDTDKANSSWIGLWRFFWGEGAQRSSLWFHCDHTSVSLLTSSLTWSHFDFISTALRFHCEITSISLRFHFAFTSMSLRFQFDLVATPRHFHSEFTAVLLRFHFGITSTSLWFHFDFT